MRTYPSKEPSSWVVIIGRGVWAKCYGVFPTYDACMVWARANQFEIEDVRLYPVNDHRDGRT